MERHFVPLPMAGFKLERDVYVEISARASREAWSSVRIEDKLARGTPDMILLRQKEYCFVEAKFLKKGLLTDPLTQLEWQPGQLAFLKRAIRSGFRYMLVIGTNDGLWYLAGENDGILYYADIIGIA